MSGAPFRKGDTLADVIEAAKHPHVDTMQFFGSANPIVSMTRTDYERDIAMAKADVAQQAVSFVERFLLQAGINPAEVVI